VDKGILGFSPLPKKLPFEDLVSRWLKEGTLHLSAQTVRRHEQVLRVHLVPHFRKTNIKAITPKLILAYVRKRHRKGAAPNTIHKELAGLSVCSTFVSRRNSLRITLFWW